MLTIAAGVSVASSSYGFSAQMDCPVANANDLPALKWHEDTQQRKEQEPEIANEMPLRYGLVLSE